MRSGANDWNEAIVERIVDVTPTVRELRLQPRSGVLPYEPGSHLQVQVLVAGRPQTRSYSLVGAPDLGAYRIAVKCLPEGRGGSLAMWRLAPGDRLSISAPQNHFPVELGAPACLLVAGGIGITPLLGIAQALAARSGRLRMLYAARSADEFAFCDVLTSVLGDRLACFDGSLDRHVDFGAEIAGLPAAAQMYVCGPLGMLDAARRAWAAAGRAASDLRYETFGSSGRFAPQAFRLRVPRHHLDTVVPADRSLLEVLDEAGVQMVSDCRRGECGLCVMDVLAIEGEIDHRDVFLSDAEKAEDKRICACVSRAVGTLTLDSAYRGDT